MPHQTDPSGAAGVDLHPAAAEYRQCAERRLREAVARSRRRLTALDRAGGEQVLARAHALLTRTWPPFECYLDATDAYYHWPSSAPDIDDELDVSAQFVGQVRETIDGLWSVPLARPLEGPLLSLPPENPRDPGGMQHHPHVAALATSLAACLPAVFLALLDDAVPTALASGPTYEARSALAALYSRYAETDPACAGSEAHLVSQVLGVAPYDDAPIEVTDLWRWWVHVTDGDSIPLRCFADLADAERYAILQTDYSRSLAGVERSASTFQAALKAIASCSPAGVTVQLPVTGWRTVLAPNRPRELPTRLADPAW